MYGSPLLQDRIHSAFYRVIEATCHSVALDWRHLVNDLLDQARAHALLNLPRLERKAVASGS